MTADPPRVAVFRPDDDRLAEAETLLGDLGADPVADPMLAVDPTGAVPRRDADYVVFTSKTGVELASAAGWTPDGAVICAIGERTAAELRAADYEVARVPAEYTSAGLVAHLEDEVDGARVELARSDHGAAILEEGLADAGAYVHETVLYQLVRPPEAGESADLAAEGALDAALFTSSLTVEHFLAAAAERGVREAAVTGLDDALVAAIGPPTKETAESAGLAVDLVPDRADFEALATAAMNALESD